MDFTKMTSIFCFVLIFCLTQAGKIPELSSSKEEVMADLESLSDVSDHQLSHADSNSPDVDDRSNSDAGMDAKGARDKAMDNDFFSEILSTHSHEHEEELPVMTRIATVNIESHAADKLFGGDMAVTNKQRYIAEHGHDVQSSLISNAAAYWKEFIADSSGKWPRLLLVPYRFATANGDVQRSVRGAIGRFNEHTCVRFIPRRASDRNYVNIIRSGGCYSYVGKIGGAQALSLGRGCEDVGIALHELIHALGYFHEQSRPDRDKHVKILWENIIDSAKSNFNKHQNSKTQDTEYDYESIMHYSDNAFSKNGRKTIERLDNPRGQLGQRNGLSALDKEGINKLYCGRAAVTTTKRTVTSRSTSTTVTRKPTPTRSPGGCPCLTTNACKTCAGARLCRVCANKKTNCNYWSGQGHCTDKYRSWMLRNCPVACACKR